MHRLSRRTSHLYLQIYMEQLPLKYPYASPYATRDYAIEFSRKITLLSEYYLFGLVSVSPKQFSVTHSLLEKPSHCPLAS